MPPKAKIAAPIDRPLSRAYLREFSGWSTAYPPGISEPTSLRIMENLMVNRDGSVRVRPGLRYLSYENPPAGEVPGTRVGYQAVGTHEAFYLNSGAKAYLFAVREGDGKVGFRVLTFAGGPRVRRLTDPEIGFAIPQGEDVLQFSAATTYVKYVQIDNKLFALSNAGEPMRMFTVGSTKTAKRLSAITRPEWGIGDKLTVVHPDASWITTTAIIGARKNWVPNPSFAKDAVGWEAGANTAIERLSIAGQSGTGVLEVRSAPTRVNLCPTPLHNVALYGTEGWVPLSDGMFTVTPDGDWARANLNTGAVSPGFVRTELAIGPMSSYPAQPGQGYVAAVDIGSLGSGVTQAVCNIIFYDENGILAGSTLQNLATGTGRKVSTPVTAPANAAYVRVAIGCNTTNPEFTSFTFRNVLLCKASEPTSMFSGSSGSYYFWVAGANESASLYHPPVTATARTRPVPFSGIGSCVGSAHVKAGASAATTATVRASLLSATGVEVASSSVGSGEDSDSWSRISGGAATIPSSATQAVLEITFANVPRGAVHYVDAAMLEDGVSVPGAYFDGSTEATDELLYAWSGEENNSTSVEGTYAAGLTVPSAETPTAETLISSDKSKNIYSFGFFYTFSNEVGESAASQITVVRAQRPWTGWRWETPSATGEPTGPMASSPVLAADQLAAYMPRAVYDAAVAEGATAWHLYLCTWSNQDPTPASALKVATAKMVAGSTYDNTGTLRITPATNETGGDTAVLPNAGNRYNYSQPSSAGQGLVASDRLVLVNDPNAAAVIRWSGNQQGDYSNFTAAKGGGYKTLTSGNLFVPAAVKLWQNPQSVDTLTILCLGTDGHSSSYYMAPAQVSSQSETVTIMGFEETTATPGTSSPYGCEVFNNALYHPLDDQLMKSTANNYNISHKSLTDQIANSWERLANKHRIVSALHDGRLYYVVHNPNGAALEEGCWGNEVWVLDAAAEGGTWSRLLIQAQSLRKIEYGGRVYMSVIRPDGIFYLDPDRGYDEYVVPEQGVIATRPIPWALETNTQGANRAHDAWAHLRQVTLTLGNFTGALEWGVRGADVHGRMVERSKVTRDLAAPAPGQQAWDRDDHLQVARDLKEWFFFARSVEGELSSGQIDLVQYRYTPVSVNVGYEYGSVETFEYGRDRALVPSSTTLNGVPVPMVDVTRP